MENSKRDHLSVMRGQSELQKTVENLSVGMPHGNTQSRRAQGKRTIVGQMLPLGTLPEIEEFQDILEEASNRAEFVS